LPDLSREGGRVEREAGRGVEESAAAAIRQSGPTRGETFGLGRCAADREVVGFTEVPQEAEILRILETSQSLRNSAILILPHLRSSMVRQRDEDWVVFRAVRATTGTTQLPTDVAELIGCTQEALANLERPGWNLAFLNRGPGRLRVVGAYHSAELVAQEVKSNRVVALVPLSKKLIFGLPVVVADYLGLDTLPHVARLEGWQDPLAWVVPAEEFYAYRRRELEGGTEPKPDPSDTHVFLTRSVFHGLFPPLRQIEDEVEPEASRIARLNRAERKMDRITNEPYLSLVQKAKNKVRAPKAKGQFEDEFRAERQEKARQSGSKTEHHD
jgi:hypothetical protein